MNKKQRFSVHVKDVGRRHKLLIKKDKKITKKKQQFVW